MPLLGNSPREIEQWAREPKTWPDRWPAYTLAEGLPDAARWKYGNIIVPDATGGPCPAWSDGADWRRHSDDVVVS